MRYMWDELVKIKGNKFDLVRNSECQYYSAVDVNNVIVLDNNVKRWFSNGFVLCEEHYEGCNYHKDHETYYDFYLYTILNNNLDEIYRTKTNDENYCNHLDDFKYGHLPILETQFGIYYGAIDETGRVIIKFSYSLEQVINRIHIIGIYSGLIKDELICEKSFIRIMAADTAVQNTLEIDNFILNLHTTYQDIYEILFHLILYRDSQNLEKYSSSNKYFISFREDLEYLQNRFDIYFIIEYIKDRMSISTNLSVIYSARDYDYKYFEREILDYLPLSSEHWRGKEFIEKRKDHLVKICDKLPIVKFESSIFNIVKKKNMQEIITSTPFVEGRKVVIDEYLTLQSNYTQKFTGKRIFCIYKQPATFLDNLKYKDLHVVTDITNTDMHYVADSKSIRLRDSYSYNDYIELLK